MAVVVRTPLINSAAWTKMLRRLWDTTPSASGAIVLVSFLAHMLQSAVAVLGQIKGDAFLRRGMKGWAEDRVSLTDRLEWYIRRIQEATAQTPPYAQNADGTAVFVNGKPVPNPDRISMLTANVIGPILHGRFPVDFPAKVMPEQFARTTEDIVASMRRGLTEQEDGTWRGMPDAVFAASLWNRVIEAWAVDVVQQEAGFFENLFREWFSQAEVDLQQSAPGEAPTTMDSVVAAVDAVKEAGRTVLKFVKKGLSFAGKLAIAGGIGLGIWGGYELSKRAKKNDRAA